MQIELVSFAKFGMPAVILLHGTRQVFLVIPLSSLQKEFSRLFFGCFSNAQSMTDGVLGV